MQNFDAIYTITCWIKLMVDVDQFTLLWTSKTYWIMFYALLKYQSLQ